MDKENANERRPASTGAAPGGEEVSLRLIGNLGRDALRYLPAVIVPAALNLLSVAIFTRIFTLGPYGEYSLAIAVTALTISVAAGWLQQSVVRYLPRYQMGAERTAFVAKVNAIVWMTAGLVIVVSLAAYEGVGRWLGAYQRYYFPSVALLVVWMMFMVYNAIFQASLRSSRYAAYYIAYAVGRIVFALAFVMLVARDAVGLVVGSAVAYAVIVVPMMIELGLFKVGGGVAGALDFELIKRFLRYGLPVVGWAVAIKVLELSDRFVIAAFRGTEEVGIYSANYVLAAAIIGFVSTPIMLAADPIVINAWEQGSEVRIKELIRDFSRYFLLAVFPVATFVCVYASKIAGVAFAQEYREGYVVIPVVVAGVSVWAFSMYGNKGVKLAEKTPIMFALLTISAAANIGLNLVLVPSFGYMGAAIATLLSYVLYAAMTFFATRRYVAWVIPWRSIVNIAIASLAAAGFWFALRTDLRVRILDWLVWVAAGAGGILLYVGVLRVLGELRPYERTFVRDLLRGRRG